MAPPKIKERALTPPPKILEIISIPTKKTKIGLYVHPHENSENGLAPQGYKVLGGWGTLPPLDPCPPMEVRPPQ